MTEHGVRAPSSGAGPTLVIVALAGALGGFTLGVVARVWMRLVAEDPTFTWTGTGYIVTGFTVFGASQAVVGSVRRTDRARWGLMVVRVIGALSMLPLFVAAGAVMLPTVVVGGLAVARTGWRPLTRWLCALVAAGPVVVVAVGLVGSFGWSLRSVAGVAMCLAIYAAVIRATRATFMARLDGRWPCPATRQRSTVMAILPRAVPPTR
ncbi:MAG: hypothetical protein IT196_07560 [Acidimicrobiales bacterium]|nr:hypothetical protein [Acidimicrobiales bacterium]